MQLIVGTGKAKTKTYYSTERIADGEPVLRLIYININPPQYWPM